MTISSSSLKIPISQEIETPTSFNFSIPPPEESLSTPVCRVGETGKSNTLLTKVVMSPALQSEEIVPHNVQHVFDQTPKSFDVSSEEEEEE
ncbi:hypothetical protein H5410_021166 [Solanum commersonii]|uniref:Uncharacterized protein n=1 Tax=Solanum commersonii TaxID=4109 RepID=A0A9J5ZBW2_SOLCO|nr:hypothetical protein H5410_021166 [Solanum commersonii]